MSIEAEHTPVVLHNVRAGFDGALLFGQFDLTVRAGEFVAVLGPSGAGKSTLLRLIAGLLKPASGVVQTSAPVALMTQDDALLPWADPLENVILGDRLRGVRPDMSRARTLLEQVGLEAGAKRPGALSGGMRKRVALARLLYENRPVALLDEPFAALDAITRRTVQELTRRMLHGRSVVLVTHDPFEALAMADRVIVLGGMPVRTVLDEHLPGAGVSLRDPAGPALRDHYLHLLAALESVS